MLVHLAQEELDIRQLVLVQLASHGVEDPHGYLPREMEGLGRQVTFGATSSSTLPPYNPIEVINYFVMVEHKNELARQRVVTPPPAPPPERPEEELPHNTVVALPRIAQRHGETHCSCCHPERETSLALMHCLPRLPQAPPTSADPTRLWQTFTRALTLALKPQNINPFLTH